MKNLLKQIKTYKLKLFLFLLVLVGLLLPKEIALAQGQPSWLQIAFNNIIGVASNSFANTLLAVPHALSVAFAGLSMLLFNWVTGPNFITISYISMSGDNANPAVAAGWPLMRDFANIIVVLFLLWIGLATALKIEEYQAQKKLVPLIIAAILINFSPVICGFFIDISNLIMNFLLNGLTGWDAFLNKAAEILPDFNGGLEGVQNGMELLIAMILNFLGGFAFLLFGVLFIARHIALWFLVILSPLAFVCNVFPNTKKIFNQWYTQFLHWCIIGITSAFFLYLANQIFKNVTSLTPNTNNNVLDTAFPYLIPIIFLYIGLTSALATGAMGAQTIISQGQKLGKQAAKYTYGRNAALNKSIINKAGVPRAMNRLENAKGFDEKTGTKAQKWFKRQANKVIMPVVRTAGAQFGEKDQKVFEKNKKEASEKTLSQNARAWTSAMSNGEEKAAIVAATRKNGSFKDFKKLTGMTDEQELESAKNELRLDPKNFAKETIFQILPLIKDKDGNITDDAIRDFSKGLTESQKEKAGLIIPEDRLKQLTEKEDTSEFLKSQKSYREAKDKENERENAHFEAEEQHNKLKDQKTQTEERIKDIDKELETVERYSTKARALDKERSGLQERLTLIELDQKKTRPILENAKEELENAKKERESMETEYDKQRELLMENIKGNTEKEREFEKLIGKLVKNPTKVSEIISNLKIEQIKTININQVLENSHDAQMAMVENWTGEQVKAATKEGGPEFTRTLEKAIEKYSDKLSKEKGETISIKEIIEKEMIPMAKWLKSTAAISLGINEQKIKKRSSKK